MRDERAADCFRFAIPAEAIGDLEAWRLRALEAWSLGRIGGLEAQ